MATYIPLVRPGGVEWIPSDELTPSERSLAASHLNAAVGALGMRGVDRLRDFDDVRIAGGPLATTLDEVEDIDDAGGFTEIDAFYWVAPE